MSQILPTLIIQPTPIPSQIQQPSKDLQQTLEGLFLPLGTLEPHEGISAAPLMEVLVVVYSVETGHLEEYLGEEEVMEQGDKGSPMNNFPKGLIIRIGPLTIRIAVEIII